MLKLEFSGLITLQEDDHETKPIPPRRQSSQCCKRLRRGKKARAICRQHGIEDRPHNRLRKHTPCPVQAAGRKSQTLYFRTVSLTGKLTGQVQNLIPVGAVKPFKVGILVRPPGMSHTPANRLYSCGFTSRVAP